MERTPNQVVEELLQTDRLTTARQLTSWRSKHLLPPLTRRGRGRGPGAIWIWDQADIVDRAALVFDLLALRSRTSFALLGLWRCGFEVHPPALRAAWCDRLTLGLPVWMREGRGRKARLKRTGRTFEEIEDQYGDMASSIARRLESQKNAPPESMIQPVLSLLGLLYNSWISDDPEAELDAILDGLDMFSDRSKNGSSEFQTARFFSSQDAERKYHHVRERVSFVNIRTKIAKISESEINEISDLWRNLIEISSRLFGASDDDGPVQGLTEQRKAYCAFGSVGMPVLAALIGLPIWGPLKSSIILVADNSSLLQDLATEVRSGASTPDCHPPNDPLSRDLRALCGQLTDIWSKPNITFGQLLGLV